MVRINRYLAMCGLGSRRKTEEFIAAGKVKLNGEIVKDLATKVDPHIDEVRLNNKLVQLKQDPVYLLLNKPVGYVVTQKDEYGRKTIYNLLPGFAKTLQPVGRLDKNSEGLLLLTNDGELANRMIHPRYKMDKIYKVDVKGTITDEMMLSLRKGMELDGVQTLPVRAYVKSSKEGLSTLRLTLREGKKRQIRRMLEAFNIEVVRLRRLQIGPLKLNNMASGMWRLLKPGEIIELWKACHYKPEVWEQKSDKRSEEE